jgi:hypothetical protein
MTKYKLAFVAFDSAKEKHAVAIAELETWKTLPGSLGFCGQTAPVVGLCRRTAFDRRDHQPPIDIGNASQRFWIALPMLVVGTSVSDGDAVTARGLCGDVLSGVSGLAD